VGRQADLGEILEPPPGRSTVPVYDHGWMTAAGVEPFLSYVDGDPVVNWSEELEVLHTEASRTHFLDRWTRGAILERLHGLPAQSTIADIGCSTGFLLEDLEIRHPDAELIGVDLIAAGLRKIHERLPRVRLLQADACRLPIVDATIDAIVSANLLEHIPDDSLALAEMARVLRPGGWAVLVVPAGPDTYDYYDRFLGHERRYARGELSDMCRRAGLEPFEDLYLAATLYPAFWLTKQRNRRRFGHLQGSALEQRVAADIRQTKDSAIGRAAWRLEEGLGRAGLRLPFGIRSLVAARRGAVTP
jgi:ubiquinone/menaquinone biosynthesis C-methylase UbiE